MSSETFSSHAANSSEAYRPPFSLFNRLTRNLVLNGELTRINAAIASHDTVTDYPENIQQFQALSEIETTQPPSLLAMIAREYEDNTVKMRIHPDSMGMMERYGRKRAADLAVSRLEPYLRLNIQTAYPEADETAVNEMLARQTAAIADYIAMPLDVRPIFDRQRDAFNASNSELEALESEKARLTAELVDIKTSRQEAFKRLGRSALATIKSVPGFVKGINWQNLKNIPSTAWSYANTATMIGVEFGADKIRQFQERYQNLDSAQRKSLVAKLTMGAIALGTTLLYFKAGHIPNGSSSEGVQFTSNSFPLHHNGSSGVSHEIFTANEGIDLPSDTSGGDHTHGSVELPNDTGASKRQGAVELPSDTGSGSSPEATSSRNSGTELPNDTGGAKNQAEIPTEHPQETKPPLEELPNDTGASKRQGAVELPSDTGSGSSPEATSSRNSGTELPNDTGGESIPAPDQTAGIDLSEARTSNQLFEGTERVNIWPNKIIVSEWDSTNKDGSLWGISEQLLKRSGVSTPSTNDISSVVDTLRPQADANGWLKTGQELNIEDAIFRVTQIIG